MAMPKKIKLHKQDYIEIAWDNGKVFKYPLKFLRDESPDAGNKGETILWKHYAPPAKEPLKPESYEIERLKRLAIMLFKLDGKTVTITGFIHGIFWKGSANIWI